MRVRLPRGRHFAAGKNVFQIPSAQWAARRDRVDDMSEGYAPSIGTSSHLDPRAALQQEPTGSEGHTSTKLMTPRTSFRLALIDFSSSAFLRVLMNFANRLTPLIPSAVEEPALACGHTAGFSTPPDRSPCCAPNASMVKIR